MVDVFLSEFIQILRSKFPKADALFLPFHASPQTLSYSEGKNKNSTCIQIIREPSVVQDLAASMEDG